MTRYAVQCPSRASLRLSREDGGDSRCGMFTMTAAPGSATTTTMLYWVWAYSFDSLFVDKFPRQRAAKPMNFLRFPYRRCWSSDEIPCSFPC